MGIFCSKINNKNEESVFNVLRKITNTMRDLKIKEQELTSVSMPRKKAEMIRLNKEGRREHALICFKTYKMYQTTRDKYWSMKENLEKIKHEIDLQQTSIVATEGFKKASEILEKALSDTVLSNVDAIIDKCREHMQSGSEIFEELSRPIFTIEGQEEYELSLEGDMRELIKSNIDPKPTMVLSIVAEGALEDKSESGHASSATVAVHNSNVSHKHKGTLKEPLLA